MAKKEAGQLGIKVKVQGLKRNKGMIKTINTYFNLYRFVFYGIGIVIGFIISPVILIVDAVIRTTKMILDVNSDLID